MEKDWPTTQQFLLDHLRRIVEGVDCVFWGNPSNEEWFFGFGDDCLASCKESEELEAQDAAKALASIKMFLSLQALEARDRPSGPTDKKNLQHYYELLGGIFSNPPNSQAFLKKVLPENASPEQLQQALCVRDVAEAKTGCGSQ